MGFKRLDPEDFVVSSDTVTSTVWTDRTIALNNFFTSSVQKEGASGPYYLNIYQSDPTADSSEVQFATAYADSTGGGSIDYDTSVPGVSPSKTIYGQYRTLILEDENSTFSFGNQEADYFYVLSIERARYKEKLLPGSFNLTLSSSNENYDSIQLTDNSNMVTLPTYYGTMRAYEIISGSNGTSWDGGTGYTLNSGSYGLFLPDISTILLSGPALSGSGTADGSIGLSIDRSTNTNANNPIALYNHLTSSFELNAQETITSDYIFVRARNSEFNYSENPSFISGSTGEVIYDYFIDNPQTYATTIGMYNDSNELLAVAKLSKPLTKDFTKEALVRVKLDF